MQDSIISLFFVLAVFVLAGIYIFRPFTARARKQRKTADHETSTLLAERDRLLNALQELDFDHALGKIPEEEYPLQRAELLQQAAGVLRAIDEKQQAVSAKSAEDRVEAVIASRRADAQDHAPVISEDDLEALIAARRSDRKEKSGGFCPNCGKPVLRSDKFCPACGKSVK
jgi:NADH pyrophosphatase NudC (nudix superfamily)